MVQGACTTSTLHLPCSEHFLVLFERGQQMTLNTRIRTRRSGRFRIALVVRVVLPACGRCRSIGSLRILRIELIQSARGSAKLDNFSIFEMHEKCILYPVIKGNMIFLDEILECQDVCDRIGVVPDRIIVFQFSLFIQLLVPSVSCHINGRLAVFNIVHQFCITDDINHWTGIQCQSFAHLRKLPFVVAWQKIHLEIHSMPSYSRRTWPFACDAFIVIISHLTIMISRFLDPPFFSVLWWIRTIIWLVSFHTARVATRVFGTLRKSCRLVLIIAFIAFSIFIVIVFIAIIVVPRLIIPWMFLQHKCSILKRLGELVILQRELILQTNQ